MTTARRAQRLESYKKFLLNRNTTSSLVTAYVENNLISEDEAAKHSFHKVIVHNWPDSDVALYDTLSNYLQVTFIPVDYTYHGEIATFYASSLSFVMKVIKHDFMFPYKHNMFNLDLLFNDRTSAECFDNWVTVDDIIAGVISNRLSDKLELDLSNFCNDPEFTEKKIHFYKLSLLSYYKILMIRMGRDTKSLNLSNNNLSTLPVDLLNFFIKGELTAINLSNNNIPSLSELQRVSSRIEKLWLEGNPLCEDLEPLSYVKQMAMKFPRLKELDGITLNQNGILLPFSRNFLETPDKRTKMLVEKFLTLYFAHYDSTRAKLGTFYDAKCSFIVNLYPDNSPYAALSPGARQVFTSRDAVVTRLMQMPTSEHDPTTFCVDVLKHDKKCLILIVDGIFREKSFDTKVQGRYYQFRRTFVFGIYIVGANSVYHIVNEIFTLSLATEEQIKNSFKTQIRNMNSLVLINPDRDETEAIIRAFTHLTQLKKAEVELRLKAHSWDISSALTEFYEEIKANKITTNQFLDDEFDDFSDTSSLIDDEID